MKVLAEPTLIALSGQNASFLAGGEYPVPVDSGDDSISIEFKSYGVGLSFKPIVLSNNRINLHVQPEVRSWTFNCSMHRGGACRSRPFNPQGINHGRAC